MATNQEIPKIYFCKTSKSAIIPKKMSALSAGYDLFATQSGVIPAGETKIINTGIRAKFPQGYYGRIADRSSMVKNHKIYVNAGVVDPDYSGDIKVVLKSGNNLPYNYKKGDRIAQIILEKYCETAEWIPVHESEDPSILEFFKSKSNSENVTCCHAIDDEDDEHNNFECVVTIIEMDSDGEQMSALFETMGFTPIVSAAPEGNVKHYKRRTPGKKERKQSYRGNNGFGSTGK